MNQQYGYELQSLAQDVARAHKEKAIAAGEAVMFKMKCDQLQEKIDHLEKQLAEKEEKKESVKNGK